LIKQDTRKFGLQSREVNSIILAIEPSSLEEEDSINNTNDLRESSILNFNFSYSLEWFEGLNGLKKIAVSMIPSPKERVEKV
jgi:hypothetical protein